MVVIAVPDGMPDLEEAIRKYGYKVVSTRKLPRSKPTPVDLIIAKEPRSGWVKRRREISTALLLAIKSGGTRARINAMAAGVDRCLALSEGPPVIAAHVNSLLRMASR